jgi:predicted small metal-binding protein
MSGGRSAEPVKVRCACGWEWAGDVEAVVAATQDHGRRIHNMDATREEVLAMAVDDGAATVTSTESERPPAG